VTRSALRSCNALVVAVLLAAVLPAGPAIAAPATPAPAAGDKTPKAPKQTRPGPKVEEEKGNNKALSDAERKRGRFHLDFDKADILAVITAISTWTNKNFILPENVRGKITIIGPQDVTADEAYAAFLAALETNNLTVTPTGRFLKIVPKKDSIRTSIPTFLEPGVGAVPIDERMVTKLFRLKYSDADPIRNVLQQFITREGEIVPFPPDVLIVSDDALNILRIDKLLAQLDQPGSSDEINVLQITHGSAQEISQVLTQIFQPQQAGAPGQRKQIAATLPKEARQLAAGAPGQPGQAAAETDSGSASVSKIIPDERTNKLIIIASGKAFQRIKELVAKLDLPTDSSQVHVYYLENANAEDLASTLSALASGSSSGSRPRGRVGGAPGAPPPPQPAGAGAQTAALFSGEVKVTAEKSTNSLLIIASPNDYRNMVKVIQRLDIRRRQVFIEAVIMEVKLNGDDRMSIDLHSGYGWKDVQVGASDKGVVPLIVGSEVSGAAASLNIAGLAQLNGFLAGVQGPPVSISGLGISLPSFGVILNALQKNSNVDVISTPHILTSANEEAEIAVGSNVPFQAAFSPGAGLGGLLGGLGTTGTTSNPASALGGLGGFGLGSLFAPIQRQPVELRLKIKPQINESDYIRMDVDVQNEEIASVDRQLGPTTAKRSVKTSIVARDQTTVVIGGLIQTRTTRAETRVPVLGSLPVIGALFRSSDTLKERTNLLLFLTPYVIRDQSDFRRIFERKMKERQEFVARFFGTDEQYAAHVDFAHKHGPLALLIGEMKKEANKAENGGPGGPDEKVVTPPGAVPPSGEHAPLPIPLPREPGAAEPGIPAPAPEAAPAPPESLPPPEPEERPEDRPDQQ